MKNYKFNNLIISLNKLRLFSTQTISNNDSQLISPWFVTGFTDAEGSFMIHLEKNKDKWRVRPTFQIKLDIRDLSLLEEIKIYFN
jgi:hypothetical protein